jgi:hypothetical protein
VVVEAWVWVNANNPGTPYIASCDTWRIFLSNNGTQVNFTVWDARYRPPVPGVPNSEINSFTNVQVPIATGTWQHIRAEFYEGPAPNGSGMLSIGVLGGATNVAAAPSNKLAVDDPGAAYVELGARFDPGTAGFSDFYRGEIDDLRISSQATSSQGVRGNQMVESFFLDFDPYPRDPAMANQVDAVHAGELATWSMATLWMGGWHNVVPADLAVANARLVDLSNPAKFAQIPLIRPKVNDSIDLDVYWGLPAMGRMLNTPVIFNRMTSAAEVSVRTILTNFVTQRDIAVSDAECTEAAIWTVEKSINHDWLHKATFLLTARYYKDHGLALSYADGKTATEHYNFWVKYLKAKLRQMAARGIDAEIGSPGYVSITLNALHAIQASSGDAVLSDLAGKFITLLLADAAAEAFHGVRGGAKTRSYSNTASFDADSDFYGYWSHLLANDPVIVPDGTTDFHAIGPAISIADSAYTPPAVLTSLMLDTNKSFDHTSRRPAKGDMDDPSQTSLNPIYHFKFPSDLRRNTYGTSKYVLGSFGAYDNVPLASPNSWNTYYTLLNMVDRWMGLIGSGWRYSRVYFQGGPGGNIQTYTNLTAVQGSSVPGAVQGSSAMVIKRAKYYELSGSPDIFCLMSDDFRRSAEGPTSATNYWIFAKDYNQDVYVALKAFNQSATSAGSYALSNTVALHGKNNLRIDFANDNDIIAFDVAPASAYPGGFADFKADVLNNSASVSSSGSDFSLSYTSVGGRTLKMFSNGSDSTIDGFLYPGNISKTYSGEYLSNSVYDDPVINLRDPSNGSLALDFNHAGYAIDPDWVQLRFDDFEAGMGGYTDDGADCLLDTGGANAHQGSKCVNIQSTGASSSVTLTSALNLATPTAYTQLKVEFWYQGIGMETGENFSLQYYNGSAWATVATYVSGTDFQNGQFRYRSVVLNKGTAPPNYVFPTNAKIRFKANGSASDDDIYIDQVRISARVK